MSASLRRFLGELRTLGLLAAPIVIGQVAQVANGFVDTVMAGRLGPLDLGAIAIGVNLWIPVMLFSTGMMMALAALVAQLCGGGQLSAIRDLVKQALMLALLLGLLSLLAIRGLAGSLEALGVHPDIAPIAAEYARAVSWGMPAICVYLVLRFMSEGIGFTRPMMVIQVLSLGLNVIANTVFMFGKLGVPAMGAVGAGWATALVMWINLALLLWYVTAHRRFQQVRAAPKIAIQWRRLRELLRVGLPIAVTLTSEVGMFAAIALLMGRFGVVQAAAHQVAVNFSAMAFMIPLGISAAITIRVGHALGQGDAVGARFRALVGIALAASCMVLTAAVMILLPNQVVAIYTDDVVVAGLAASFLLMAAMYQMSDGLQVAAMGALRGYKDTWWPMVATTIAYWLIGVPLAYVLGFLYWVEPRGLWAALIVSLALVALVLLTRFWLKSRRCIALQAARSATSAAASSAPAAD